MAGTRLSAAAGDRRRAHREYTRRRVRQIAYGRWQPWADAAPVRDHVNRLRQAGASYQSIGRAAGVAAMTVHRLARGCPAQGRPGPRRIGAAHARSLLAVTPEQACQARRAACGTRRRLQALVAIGHCPASLARAVGASPGWVHRILTGQQRTVSAARHAAACALYERAWNVAPPERTPREQAAARSARHRAQAERWPPPMALDDDKIDDPAYRPRARWRPAAGTAVGAAATASRPGRVVDDRGRCPQARAARRPAAPAGRHAHEGQDKLRRPMTSGGGAVSRGVPARAGRDAGVPRPGIGGLRPGTVPAPGRARRRSSPVPSQPATSTGGT